MSRGLFIVTAVLVLGYRALVVSMLEPTDVFELLLNLMGLTFLGAAIYTYIVQRLAHSGLAAGYLAMGALHWGGYYVFGEGQVASVIAYLVFSGVIGETLLLNFALMLTRGPLGVAARSFIYVLPALCIIVGIWAMFAAGMIDYFLVAHTVQSNLYALAAIVFLLIAWGRPHARGLGLALLVGALPYVAAEAAVALVGPIDLLGRGIEPVNLFFVVGPLGFVLVQMMIERD
ncbi:MAG: hypothetical protein V3U43_03260 [Pseudomonadales bacterium]